MLSCEVSVTAVFWLQTKILLFWDTGQLHSDALLFFFKNEKVCKRDERMRLSRLRFNGLQGFCDGNEIHRRPQIGAECSDVSLSASETTDARNGEVSFLWIYLFSCLFVYFDSFSTHDDHKSIAIRIIFWIWTLVLISSLFLFLNWLIYQIFSFTECLLFILETIYCICFADYVINKFMFRNQNAVAKSGSDASSEEENEGDEYTVYECPGLATVSSSKPLFF